MRIASLLLLLSISFLTLLFLDDWDRHIFCPQHLDDLICDTPSTSDTEIAFLHKIANQPFYFLAEGGQFYVFESRDGKYVLKFFKFHRFSTQWFIHFLPPLPFLANYKENHIARRKKRLQSVLKGVRLAYQQHKEASGLKFVQLKPPLGNFPVVAAIKGGKEYTIDLAKVAFVLQEKGEILSVLFSRMLERGDLRGVKEKISQTLRLYIQEYAKGLYDADHGVMHNIGFVGEDPIHLDVGRFVFDETVKEPRCYRKDLIKVADKIVQWVKNSYPEYSQEISDFVSEQIQNKCVMVESTANPKF